MRTHLINVNLLDGEHAARPNSTVTLDGNTIISVGHSRESVSPADLVVDLGGRSLMPGMVTGHFHPTFHNIGLERGLAGVEKPPAYMAYRAMVSAQTALRCGFTGVVGAGCSFDIDASLDAAIRDGLFPGPRVVPCSRDFQTTADASVWAPWWLHTPAGELAVRAADGTADFRKQVREEINRGARMIKVYVTGGHGVHVPKSVEIAARDELETVVETAHARGARVRVHISTKPRILHAVACGVDILDHADEMDDECIEAIAKAGTFVLPSLLYPLTMMRSTQAAGTGADMFSQEDRDDFEHMCRMLPTAVAAGVRLCIGDDYGSPVMPHGWYGRELAVYTQYAGIDPLEVIRWATHNGGQLLGERNLGTVAAGELADLLVVDGDPSKDISLLADPARILTVIKDGVVVSGALPGGLSAAAAA